MDDRGRQGEQTNNGSQHPSPKGQARLHWDAKFETSKEDIARYEALALDALVAAGKITEADRAQVVFIINFIVKPRFDENGAVIPRNMLN
jgi:hypothetical protein